MNFHRWSNRLTFVATVGIIIFVVLTYSNGMFDAVGDIAGAVAFVALVIAAAIELFADPQDD